MGERRLLLQTSRVHSKAHDNTGSIDGTGNLGQHDTLLAFHFAHISYFLFSFFFHQAWSWLSWVMVFFFLSGSTIWNLDMTGVKTGEQQARPMRVESAHISWGFLEHAVLLHPFFNLKHLPECGTKRALCLKLASRMSRQSQEYAE